MANILDLEPAPAAREAPVAEGVIKDYLVAAALHQLERVRHFIECRDLHPDTTYGGKPTALCYSVLKPHHALMTYLIGKGADPDRLDQMGMTPLHYAALGGCEVCLAALVVCGAKLSGGNRRGQTPLALALTRPSLAGGAEFLRRCGATLEPSLAGPRRFH